MAWKYGSKKSELGFHLWSANLVFVLNFRRVTSIFDLGECLLLDAYHLPSAVYQSSLQTQQLSSKNLWWSIGALLRDIYCQLCEKVSLLNLRRVTSKLYFGECLSLIAEILASAVHLSPLKTSPTSNDGYFMIVQFGAKQAQIFGYACSKRKWHFFGLFFSWLICISF